MTSIAAELSGLERDLATKRAELSRLSKDCRLLREQRERLLLELEGQLDLFREGVARGERVLKEIPHG